MTSFVPSAIALGVVAILALVLTFRRDFANQRRHSTTDGLTAGLAAIAAQSVHFLEEFLFDFRSLFPELFNLPPMSERFFVTFNVFWLCVWTIALIGLQYRMRVALFPLWFLGIALAANALGHVALSFVARGYFPGLFTVPLVAVAGIILLVELTRLTETSGTPPDRLDERYWNA